MPALSEMPLKAQKPHDAMDYVLDGIDQERTGRIQAVYALWEIYRLLPDYSGLPGQPGPRQSLLNEVGSKRNIAPSRLEEWLAVPERIPYELLMGSFPPTPDGEPSWHLSLTWTHLEKAAKVGGMKEDGYEPSERVRWLTLVADNEWSTADFENWLRERGLIQVRKAKSFTPEDDAKDAERVNKGYEAAAYLQKCLAGDYGPDVKTKVTRSWGKRSKSLPVPKTACMLLELTADELRRQGADIDLSGMLAQRKPGRPIDAATLLEFLATEYKREHPGVQFQLSEGAKIHAVGETGNR